MNALSRAVFFLLSIIVCIQATAQKDALLFENYNSEQGLSQNSGYALTQDQQGFIWIGTQDGLNRFDGLRFKVFRNNPADSFSIPFNEVSALLTDKQGHVWICSPLGTAVYDPAANAFYRVSQLFHSVTDLDGLSGQKLFLDKEDNIWILSRYNGLFRFDHHTKTINRFFSEPGLKDQLSGITQDSSGHIWVSTSNELYRLVGNVFQPCFLKSAQGFQKKEIVISDLSVLNNELWIATLNDGIIIRDPGSDNHVRYLVAGATDHGLSSNNIKCLYKDRKNKMWVGTRNQGICRYDPETGKLAKAVHSFFSEHSLARNFVLSIFQDNQGIVWAGLSGGGLAKYDPGKFQFAAYRQIPNTKNTLSDNMIFCLYGKNENELMLGTQNGGLVNINWPAKKFTVYMNDPANTHSLINNTVYAITQDAGKNYWLATWGGLCEFRPGEERGGTFNAYTNNLLAKYLYSVIYLENTNALLTSGPNGLFNFHLEDKSWKPCNDKYGYLNNHTIVGRYFLPRGDSSVWIATEGLGLILYNYISGEFREIPSVYAIAHNIRYVLAAKDSLWLGTDNGLILLDAGTQRLISTWNSQNGLPNDVVYAILKDKNNRLWLSTNNGLSCFDPKKNDFKNYDEGYGLNGLEFNTASCYADPGGNLYFGGVNGFNVFDPLAIVPNTYTPDVKITSFRVFDKELKTAFSLSFTSQIELKHEENFITVYFTALNYSHTDKNIYAYQLEEVDEKWIYAGNRDFASYTQLPPGNYHFRVKAANSDGQWSKQETELKIFIHPPFWLTWWFRIVMLSLIVAFVFMLWTRKVKQIRKEERLKAAFNKKLADAETAALRAQMNPHFIFNTLNSINSYIMDNNPRLASDYLTKFARLIRIILENSKNEIIPLCKEIETLKLYLLMESIRFNNKFDHEMHVGPEVDTENIRIPPMIIQPYVENAIWHGLMHKPEKGKVSIAVSLAANRMLKVSIRDNGIGRKRAMELKSKASNLNKSYGIRITGDRLLMNNEQNNVEVLDVMNSDGEAAGTTVILTIKI